MLSSHLAKSSARLIGKSLSRLAASRSGAADLSIASADPDIAGSGHYYWQGVVVSPAVIVVGSTAAVVGSVVVAAATSTAFV